MDPKLQKVGGTAIVGLLAWFAVAYARGVEQRIEDAQAGAKEAVTAANSAAVHVVKESVDARVTAERLKALQDQVDRLEKKIDALILGLRERTRSRS